jgi:hypothetical protein
MLVSLNVFLPWKFDIKFSIGLLFYGHVKVLALSETYITPNDKVIVVSWSWNDLEVVASKLKFCANFSWRYWRKPTQDRQYSGWDSSHPPPEYESRPKALLVHQSVQCTSYWISYFLYPQLLSAKPVAHFDISTEDTAVKVLELIPPLNTLITEDHVKSRRIVHWDVDG